MMKLNSKAVVISGSHYEKTRWPSRYQAGRKTPSTPKLDMDPAEGDWMVLGSCRELDPELFFPIGRSGEAELKIIAAKQACARCPVIAECLAFALDTGQEGGVWGGTSEEERQEMRQHARQRPAA